MIEQWPIRTELKHDETLLSFLVRSALANGTYPHVLFQSWRNSQHTFTSDIDKIAADNDLLVLSNSTGIELDSLKKSLLIDILKPLLDQQQYENTKSWRYVMHLGARNHRRSFGYGFCPECMADEASRYYRRQWRLLWHVGCQEHHCKLVYNCPSCGTENKPHSLSWQASSINACSQCGHTLSSASKKIVHNDALTVAAWLDHYLHSGVNTSQWQFSDIQEAALTLRQLMSIVRAAFSKPHIRYNQAMLDWMGIAHEVLTDSGCTNLEQWTVSLRELTLRGAWRLLSLSQDELVTHCQLNNVSQKFWLHDNKPKIPAIQRIANHLIVNTRIDNKTRSCNRIIEPLPRDIVEKRWLAVQGLLKMRPDGQA